MTQFEIEYKYSKYNIIEIKYNRNKIASISVGYFVHLEENYKDFTLIIEKFRYEVHL